jgi:hypothetical protein
MQLAKARASLATRGESRMNAGGNNCGKPVWLSLTVVLGCLLLGVYSSSAWALQRHTLQGQSSRSDVRHGATPDQTAGAPETPIAQERAGASPTPAPAPPPPPGVPAAVTSPSAPPGHEQAPHPAAPAPQPSPPAKAEKHEAPPAGKEAAHGAGKEAHGEHGVKLPEVSPIPGVTFVETIIKLMDYELHGRFLGWRPNDLIIGRFTDDINNYQLGVLEAIRFTTFRSKDSLTRMGDADAYDRDLESALNLFMNRATLLWFPSAEGSYDEALDHLRKFLHKLQTGQRNFYYRVDNLTSLLTVYKDLLGNINRSLIMANHADGTPVSWFEVDDYYYYAKGVAHVMFEVLKVVRVGFKAPLDTLRANEMMDEVLHELHRVELLEPWIILDGNLDGFLANHRANLNAPLSEVTHLLTIMSHL